MLRKSADSEHFDHVEIDVQLQKYAGWFQEKEPSIVT